MGGSKDIYQLSLKRTCMDTNIICEHTHSPFFPQWAERVNGASLCSFASQRESIFVDESPAACSSELSNTHSCWQAHTHTRSAALMTIMDLIFHSFHFHFRLLTADASHRHYLTLTCYLSLQSWSYRWGCRGHVLLIFRGNLEINGAGRSLVMRNRFRNG